MQTKLGKMAPRKSQKIPVAIRKMVIEAYLPEKNKTKLQRYRYIHTGTSRKTISSIIKNVPSVENKHRSERKPTFTVHDVVQLS